GFHVTGVQTCALPILNGQGAGAPPALRGEALASASPRAEVRSDPGAPAEDALEEAGAGVAEARGGATPEGVADAAVLDRGRFVEIGRAACRERGWMSG